MQTDSPMSPGLWEREWQAAIDLSPIRRRATDNQAVKMNRWNKMAADFAERISTRNREAEREKIIEQLVARDILRPGVSVLDIGAGPGAWSLPLAGVAGHVTALEPSDGMADILQDRITDQNIGNITIDRRTWQSVDLDADGWRGRFDLVFASMTPGIDGPESIHKMIAASRDACYLSAFAGPKWQDQYDELWQTFFNEPLGKHPGDIIYPLNLVYAMGFRPSLEFSWWNRENSISRDKAVERFCLFFENYLEVTEKIKRVITDHIDRRCVDGWFVQSRKVCRGTMIWRVSENQVLEFHDRE